MNPSVEIAVSGWRISPIEVVGFLLTVHAKYGQDIEDAGARILYFEFLVVLE